jgi:hypothetical protein
VFAGSRTSPVVAMSVMGSAISLFDSPLIGAHPNWRVPGVYFGSGGPIRSPYGWADFE